MSVPSLTRKTRALTASPIWEPIAPPPDLRAAGEAMTADECDEMLACIAALLRKYRLNGSTHAEMLRWKVQHLFRYQRRPQKRRGVTT